MKLARIRLMRSVSPRPLTAEGGAGTLRDHTFESDLLHIITLWLRNVSGFWDAGKSKIRTCARQEGRADREELAPFSTVIAREGGRSGKR
jgi:hypothetical protein